MKELLNKEIKRYNYNKTKDFVEDELSYLSHLGTKLFCLLPPGAGRTISFLEKVDGTKPNGSAQEKYVEKKDYLERELKKEIEKYEDNLRLMTEDEKLIFEEMFIYQTTDFDIEEKTGWSKKRILHVKKSFVIKFALSMGVDFENWVIEITHLNWCVFLCPNE